MRGSIWTIRFSFKGNSGSNAMKKTILFISFLTMLLSGCASYSTMNQMKKFDPIQTSYETAIRWSDFEAASSFRKGDLAAKDPVDFNHLKLIKVISYELKQVILPMESEETILQIAQVVEIKYYKIDDLVQRTLTDRQLWEYDEARENWFLVSRFPDFK
jgi:hypothetical protein